MQNNCCLIQLVLLPGFLCQNFDEWFSKGLVVNYKVSHWMNERSIEQFFEMWTEGIYGTRTVYSEILIRPPSWWLKWASFWMIPLTKNSGNIQKDFVHNQSCGSVALVDKENGYFLFCFLLNYTIWVQSNVIFSNWTKLITLT